MACCTLMSSQPLQQGGEYAAQQGRGQRTDAINDNLLLHWLNRLRTCWSKPPEGLVSLEMRPMIGRPPCTCLPTRFTLSTKPL